MWQEVRLLRSVRERVSYNRPHLHSMLDQLLHEDTKRQLRSAGSSGQGTPPPSSSSSQPAGAPPAVPAPSSGWRAQLPIVVSLTALPSRQPKPGRPPAADGPKGWSVGKQIQEAIAAFGQAHGLAARACRKRKAKEPIKVPESEGGREGGKGRVRGLGYDELLRPALAGQQAMVDAWAEHAVPMPCCRTRSCGSARVCGRGTRRRRGRRRGAVWPGSRRSWPCTPLPR